MPKLDIFPAWLKHGVLDHVRARRLQSVRTAFSAMIDVDEAPDFALSLHPFCDERPFTFFDRDAATTYLDFLESDPAVAMDVLGERAQSLTHAIQVATRPGPSLHREERLQLDNPVDFLEVERTWHPEYQKYAEHVLNHLLRVVARILEHRRPGKNYVGMRLGALHGLLQSEAPALVAGLNPLVRNAIAHGSVRLSEHEIEYLDNSKSESLWASDFTALFDRLVDGVHGVLVALLVFLVRHHQDARRRGLVRLPLGLRWLLARSAVGHAGFTMTGVLDAGDVGGRRLNVYCESETRSRNAYIFEALQVAYGLLHFDVSDFDRLWFAVDCGPELPAVFELKVPALLAGRSSSTVPTDIVGGNLRGTTRRTTRGGSMRTARACGWAGSSTRRVCG